MVTCGGRNCGFRYWENPNLWRRYRPMEEGRSWGTTVPWDTQALGQFPPICLLPRGNLLLPFFKSKREAKPHTTHQLWYRGILIVVPICAALTGTGPGWMPHMPDLTQFSQRSYHEGPVVLPIFTRRSLRLGNLPGWYSKG